VLCPQIPFFRKYRSWKSFTVWKKSVRCVRTSEAKTSLRSNLFLFVPALRTALGRIRALSTDVEAKRLLAMDAHKTYILEEFIAHQRDVQEQLRAFLLAFSAQVHTEVSAHHTHIYTERDTHMDRHR
jgi:dynein heavy chain